MKRLMSIMAVLAMIFVSCEKPQIEDEPLHEIPEEIPEVPKEPEDDGILSTFHYMEASTPNGIMGDARTASAEKGRKLINAYADNIAEALADEIVWSVPV